nr:hypothetical protein [Tanacetum cinerariifolium]GEW68226.1 hypothetical protein [Tanacetum cinerariifolium]
MAKPEDGELSTAGVTFAGNINRQLVSNYEPCACDMHVVNSGNFPNQRSCSGTTVVASCSLHRRPMPL